MSEWKINNVLAETLGVIDIQFTFGNMVPDVARLDMNLDYDASVPSVFDFGQMVGISLDGVQVFYGESQGPNRVGAGTAETIQVDVFAGWHELSCVPAVKDVADAIAGGVFSSANVTVAAGTASAQVAEVVNLAVAGGAKLQAGIYDLPEITLPSVNVQTANAGELLKQILKWVPGVQVVFDYTNASATTAPKCNVLQLSSTTLLEVSKTDMTGMEYRKRYDLVPTGVKLIFQRPVSNAVTTLSPNNPSSVLSTSKAEAVTHVLTESAGVISPRRRAIIASITLGGTTDRTLNQYKIALVLKRQSFYEGIYPGFGITNYYRYFGDMLSLMGCPGMTYEQVPGKSEWAWTPITGYPMCLKLWEPSWSYYGSPAGNYSKNCSWVVPASSCWPDSIRDHLPFVLNYPTLKLGWKVGTLTSWWANSWTQPANLWIQKFHIIPHGSLCWAWTGVDMEDQSFVSPENFTIGAYNNEPARDAESVVTGLAAQTLSRLQTLYQEGSIATEFRSISPLARVVTIDGVRAPIQQSSFNAKSMIHSASFGPPSQLEPQDLLTISRAVAERR